MSGTTATVVVIHRSGRVSVLFELGIWSLFPRVPRTWQSLFLRNAWPDSGSMFFLFSQCL